MNLIFYIYAIIFVSFAKTQGLRSLVLFTYLTWEITVRKWKKYQLRLHYCIKNQHFPGFGHNYDSQRVKRVALRNSLSLHRH